MTFLLLLAILGFATLALFAFEWAFALMVFLLPSYVWRFSVFGIPMTFLEAMILTLTAIWVWRLLMRSSRWPSAAIKRMRLPLGLFLLAVAIAVFVTPNVEDALGQLKAYVIEPLLVLLMMFDVCKEEVWRRRLIHVLIFSGVVVGAIAILQYGTGWGIPDPWRVFPGRRAVSIYPYPNAIGLYLAPLLLWSLGSLLFSRSELAVRKSVAILSAFMMTIGIFVSVAEGAVVGVVAGFFLMLMFTKYRWPTIAGAIGLIFVLFALPLSRNYLLPLITFQDISGDVRWVLWQGTVKLLADHPFVGAGLAGFQQAYDQYRLAKHTELLLYPHNIFLNFWVEFGMMGLIAMIWIVVKFFQCARNLSRTRVNDRSSFILMGAMVGVLVYGFVEAPFFKNDLAVLWWIIIGMPLLLEQKATHHRLA